MSSLPPRQSFEGHSARSPSPPGHCLRLTWVPAVRARIVARSRQHVLYEPIVALRFHQRHGDSIRPGSPRWGNTCSSTSAAGRETRGSDRQQRRPGGDGAVHLSPPPSHTGLDKDRPLSLSIWPSERVYGRAHVCVRERVFPSVRPDRSISESRFVNNNHGDHRRLLQCPVRPSALPFNTVVVKA